MSAITIKDNVTGKKLPINIKVYDGHMLINPKGYGDKVSKDGDGSPIMVEYYDGKLRVLLWSDINMESPTHMITMEGAKESNRE